MTEADVLRAENAIFREQIQQLQREKDRFWRLILQVQEEKESSRKQNQDLMKQNQDLMKQNQDLMKQSQDLMKNLNEKDLFIDRMATEHRNDRLEINTRLDSLIESQRSMVNRIVQGQRTIMSTLDGGIEAVRDRLGNIEARLTTHPESTAKVHGFGIVHQRSCNGGNFARFISGQEQYVRRQLRRRVPQETRHNRVLRNFTPHANGINTRNILASIANRQIGVRSQVPVPSTIQTHRCSKRKLEEEGQSSDASLLVGTIPKISRLRLRKHPKWHIARADGNSQSSRKSNRRT